MAELHRYLLASACLYVCFGAMLLMLVPMVVVTESSRTLRPGGLRRLVLHE